MLVNINRTDNNVLAEISGRLDTLSSDDFNSQMEQFLNEEGLNLTIDCAGLEYIASYGLRSLLSLYKSLLSHSGTLTLINLKPAIMQVFKMTGFSDFLNIK